MGQNDVLVWMVKEARCGRWCFFTRREVERGLQGEGFTNGVIRSVGGDLNKLVLFGYLDTAFARNEKEWPGRYRVKEFYLVRLGLR
jgi:hypothetical protein